jgi:hypothetical protein
LRAAKRVASEVPSGSGRSGRTVVSEPKTRTVGAAARAGPPETAAATTAAARRRLRRRREIVIEAGKRTRANEQLPIDGDPSNERKDTTLQRQKDSSR